MNSVDLNSSSVQLFETQNPVQQPNSSAVQRGADEDLKTLRANASGIDFKPVAIGEGTSNSLISEETRSVLAELTARYHAAELDFELAPLRVAFTSMSSSLMFADENEDYSGLTDRFENFQEGVRGMLARGIEFNPFNPYLDNDNIREKLESILPGSTDGEPNDQTNTLTWVLNGEAAENAGMAGINVLTFDFSEMLAGDADVAVGVLAEAFSNWSAALEGVHDSIGSARDAQIEMLSKPAESLVSEAAANVEKDMNVDQAREKAQHVQTELAKQVFSLANATSPSALASFGL
ncbi:hypothetical protein SAMN04488518_11924 [Pseudovibrio ascidiaceicola]|uniref:Flagellin n=1 Tax=Pseudovibrio ascidiaceicola TaxID=285279 RepID=A0A1I4FIX7_9HYPH|nr:hypothetical protein [Pseudovibrio ascidiaceicola]SFL16867.1 hypothetical protein SAMN04488518_11924 [Pseudovibrio ascidiaceicola]